MSHPEGPEWTVLQCLRWLENALDPDADFYRRSEVLNDVRVPDEIVALFVLTLPADVRVRAFRSCNRSMVLAAGAGSGLVEDRIAVASNLACPVAVQLRLAHDPDVEVCAALTDQYPLDVDVAASLIAHPSFVVQEALAHYFACERANDEFTDDTDSEPGSQESLAFLYGMVPGAEAEECLADWAAAKAARETEPHRIAAASPDDALSADNPSEVADTDTDGAWNLSLHQVIELLKARLGAEVLQEDE